MFTLPSAGSSAAFFNPDVGCIATGSYPGGYIARILYTVDGGRSWTESLLPNLDLFGQVTDISYYDRWTVWATVREKIEHGWSGIYKSVDGGITWKLWFQAEFPVSIRQTSRGLFFTDRYLGIRRSTDGGQTFDVVAPSSGALGLDFMDDLVGVSSSEGTNRAPTYVTIDGGATWFAYDLHHEAWTAFADPATRAVFVASEADLVFPATESELINSTDFGHTYNTQWTGGGDAISGGIGGAKWCRSVLYAQGQDSSAKIRGLNGFVRSTDGGVTWVRVGGPSNLRDKRFAVTGKGAVVYAFDKGDPLDKGRGGVWKTSDGGDGKLTTSALGYTSLKQISSGTNIAAKLCDSADYLVELHYSDCDSVLLSSVAFIDDSLGELRSPKKYHYFGKNNSRVDTLLVRLNPKKLHSQIERIRLTLKQSDGTSQDTIISVSVQGLAAPEQPLIEEAGTSNAIDFGSGSVCGGDSVRVVTITNTGCSPMRVTSLQTNGAPFFLLSSFNPFTLDPGVSRQILIQFKPTAIGNASGKLTMLTSASTTTVTLTGIGKAGERGFILSQPVITSTICDSNAGTLVFRNISCTPVRIDSLGVDAPFRFDPLAFPIVLKTDSVIIIHFHFTPSSDGTIIRNVTVHSVNDNNVTQPFDTILSLIAVATRGLPVLTLSSTRLDYGSLSTCGYRDLELTLTNDGCDTLKIIDNTLQGSPNFTIRQTAQGISVLRFGSTKIIIRLKPTSSVPYNGQLTVHTNAGGFTVDLSGAGLDDPGSLTLTATPIGKVLTCRDSSFALTLSNTTCDSLTLDSIKYIGIGGTDYTTNFIVGTFFEPGKILVLNGKFTPQIGGDRSAIAHLYLHLPNGTFKEITVAMNGAGIQPVVIHLGLPNANLSESQYKKLRIPIQLLDPTVIPVTKISFTLDFNTDLISPESFDLSGSVIGGGANVTATATSATVTINASSPQLLNSGLLGTLVLLAYTADTLHTDIILQDFSVLGIADSKDCLPTEIITPPIIHTSFDLATSCGDTVLSHFMRYGISGVGITSIVPNPSHGSVKVTFSLPLDYHNDGKFEVFDALGNKLQSQMLIAGQSERVIEKTFELTGDSGLRILRVSNGTGVESASFILSR